MLLTSSTRRRFTSFLLILGLALFLMAVSTNAGILHSWGHSNNLPGVPTLAKSIDVAEEIALLEPNGRVRLSTGLIPGWFNVVLISQGTGFIAGLTSSGKVLIHGENAGDLAPPVGLPRSVAISAGTSHLLALGRDGLVRSWGANAQSEVIEVPQFTSRVIAISAGGHHNLALLIDGTVIAWGANNFEQCDVPALSPVTAISAGEDHSLVLLQDGSVVGWGRDDQGQASVPSGLAEAVEVAAGRNHSLALIGGAVRGWGSNTEGESAVTNEFPGVVSIAAGNATSASITSTSERANLEASRTIKGAFGIPQNDKIIASGTGVTYSAFGLPRGLRINGSTGRLVGRPRESGEFLAAIRVRNGANEVTRVFPFQIAAVSQRPTSIALNNSTVAEGESIGTAVGTLSANDPDSGETFTFWLPTKGRDQAVFEIVGNELRTKAVFDFEKRQTYLLRIRTRDSFGLELETTFEIQISNAALDQDNDGVIDDTEAFLGTSDSMVDSDSDEVSDADEITEGFDPANARSTPARVRVLSYTQSIPQAPANLGPVIQAISSLQRNAVLTRDGTVKTWNYNNEVTEISDRGDLVEIAYGEDLLGLRADGTLVMVSANPASTPPALDDVIAIAAGGAHYLALRANGKVVAWGPTSPATNLPETLQDVVAIAATSARSLALCADGTLHLFGYNFSFPSQVANIRAIGTGYLQSYALKSDGRVLIWGWGSGFPDNYSNVPVSLSPVQEMAGTIGRSSILTANGKLREFGIYGEHATTRIISPVIHIAGGLFHTLAITASPAAPKMERLKTIWANKDQSFAYTVAATGGPTFFRALELPAGLEINAQTGLISGIPITAGQFRIRIFAANPSGVTSQTILLKVRAGTHGPSSVQLDPNSVLENEEPGTKVGNLLSTDPDAGDVFRYSLVPGTGSQDNLKFMIVDGELRTAVKFDFETKNQYSIRVRAMDSADLKHDKILSVQILNSTQEDTDGDGLLEAQEITLGTSDNNPDSDGDGVNDGTEVAQHADPSDAESIPPTLVHWAGYHAPTPAISGVVALSGRINSFLALRRDGTVWDSATQNAPIGTSNVIAIAAGPSSNMALQSDGNVTVWGSNVGFSPDFSNTVAIAQGGFILKSDGMVTAGQQPVPPELDNAIDIAGAGTGANAVCCVLKSDGTAVKWSLTTGAIQTFQNVESIWSGLTSVTLIFKDDTLATNFATKPAVPNVLSANEGSGLLVAITEDGLPSMLSPFLYPLEAYRRVVPNEVHHLASAVVTQAAVGLKVSPQTRLTAERLITGMVNTPFEFTPTAVNSESFLALGLPTGLSINPESGVVSGTPELPGNFTCRIVAYGPATMATRMLNLRISAGDNPPGSSVLSSASVLENAVAGTIIGTFTGSDTDAGDQFSFELVNGAGNTDNASFQIVRNVLKTRLPLDYEAGATRSICIRTTDISGLSSEQEMVIALQNVTDEDNDGLSETEEATLGTSDHDLDSDHDLATDQNEFLAGTNPLSAASFPPTVVAWGSNGLNQTDVPATLSGVAQVSAGTSHSLALKLDGTVVGWGSNTYGQATPPAGLNNVVSCAAGWHQSLALLSNGTVVVWGSGLGSTVPAGLNNVIAIAAGDSISMALLGDGTVVQWGTQFSGPGYKPFPTDLHDIVGISCGWYNPVVVSADGIVTVWGSLGNVGGNSNQGITHPPDTLHDVITVGAGEAAATALQADGQLIGWGPGGSIQYGGNFIDFAAGGQYVLGIKENGSLYFSGSTFQGQNLIPQGLTPIACLSAGGYHVLAIKASGVPQITNLRAADASVQTEFTLPISANGATKFGALSLPPGLSINVSTGVISGMPQTAGVFYALLTAENQNGRSTLVVRITVAE